MNKPIKFHRENRICSIEGCNEKYFSSEFCKKHYAIKYRKDKPEIMRNIRIKSYQKLRKFFFDILGYKCVKCGLDDIRILQFDHIKGGGVKEQKFHGNNARMYIYYRKHSEDITKTFQILCPNCNMLKRIINKETPNSDRYWK